MLQGVLLDDGLGTSSYIVGTRTPLLVLSREQGYNPYMDVKIMVPYSLARPSKEKEPCLAASMPSALQLQGA